MPVVLSVEDAAQAFGAGSTLHGVVTRILHPPPPRRCESCNVEIPWSTHCTPCGEVRDRFVSLYCAFRFLGECVGLVDEYARALADTDQSALLTLEEWRARAFDALALVSIRAPGLMPFRGDDGDDR
jgi:hypothetical protein